MTDLYPDEEGYISDGTIVGFCKAAAAITLHGAVKLGLTAVSSYISVIPATVGAGYGIALRAADTNDYIPVAFKGIVKQIVGTGTFVAGAPVVASGTTAGVVEKQGPLNGTTMLEYVNLGFGGTTNLYRLGYALQAGTTAGDEVLVMLAGLQ